VNEITPSEDTLAAADLGSNSFHLIVAGLRQGQLQVLDRLREPVRLAAGLDKHQRLHPEARARALACLERFGQRLRHLPARNVRVVGTNALRQAQGTGGFLRDAEAAIGHPIEIISGVEEARLIYLGVSHSLPDAGGRRLVVDIGGGSTELIIGEGFEALYPESLYMGCVSFSERYFPDGQLGKEGWRGAEIAAGLELRPVQDRFRRLGWESVAGASGTIRAIREVLQTNQWCEQGISRDGLQKLRKALQQVEHVDALNLPGLAEERKPVLAGGVVILWTLFDTLGIEQMRVSDGALREGLLYDAIGRIQQVDVRERTVNSLMERYHVDTAHASQVEQTALRLFDQVRKDWKLEDDEYPAMLRWAARLHEIGLVIAHSGYQKHGAYLLANSDLPGFSRREQSLLAVLVLGHRRKFPVSGFDSHGKAAQRLCVLLRLAILLHRSRGPEEPPAISLRPNGTSLELVFPEAWLAQHPMTEADLAREVEFLKAAKWKLQVR
jgi:exopolyphosphatase / guanosine-5'-triphosphate,3'-diphosphate pyrophosphatase